MAVIRSADRREARRLRRGRQSSVQQGKGNGDHAYRPVLQTNRLVTEDGRERRRDVLAAREARIAEQVEGVRARVKAREAASDAV